MHATQARRPSRWSAVSASSPPQSARAGFLHTFLSLPLRVPETRSHYIKEK